MPGQSVPVTATVTAPVTIIHVRRPLPQPKFGHATPQARRAPADELTCEERRRLAQRMNALSRGSVDLETARACVDAALAAGIPVTSEFATALIRAYVGDGQLDEAIKVQQDMYAPGLRRAPERPFVGSYGVLITALVNADRMMDAFDMLQYGVNSGVFHADLGLRAAGWGGYEGSTLDFHNNRLREGRRMNETHRTSFPPREVVRAIFEYHVWQKAMGNRGIDSRTRFWAGTQDSGSARVEVRACMVEQGWQPKELPGDPGCLVCAGTELLDFIPFAIHATLRRFPQEMDAVSVRRVITPRLLEMNLPTAWACVEAMKAAGVPITEDVVDALSSVASAAARALAD